MTRQPIFDMFDPDFRANPHEFYRELRESGPVTKVGLPGFVDTWLVTRYADAKRALTDPAFSKDPSNAPAALREVIVDYEGEDNLPLMASMLNSDPPDHSRLRKLVAGAFTARRIQALRPRIQEISDALIDDMLPRGEADLIDDFAFPLPITVICELLGIPAEDRNDFRRWSMLLTSAGADERALVRDAFKQLRGYLADLVERKHTEPDQALLSALVSTSEGGDRLTDDEATTMALLLLIAGHETTVNLIGNGVLALLRHPDQLAAVRADESLVDAVVEETVRYDGSLENATWRFTTADVHFDDVTVPKGEPVLVVLAAADRDPERFAEPDAFDIHRPENPHIAFGYGVHYCLGASLARLEGQIAIGTLLRRLPDLRLAVEPGQLRWRPGVVIRGVQHLPISFRPV